MVRNGFRLEDIYNLTLPQIKLYVHSVDKLNNLDFINTLNSVRIGYHADDKNYKKIIDKLIKGT